MNPKWISKFQLKPGAWIFVPTTESVQVGKEIKKAIEERWTFPSNYYHLKNGGHVEALRSHLKHSSFVHLDIRDFLAAIAQRGLKRMDFVSIACALLASGWWRSI